VGTTLQTISDPDHVTIIKVDQSTLPKGAYRTAKTTPRKTETRTIETQQGKELVRTFDPLWRRCAPFHGKPACPVYP